MTASNVGLFVLSTMKVTDGLKHLSPRRDVDSLSVSYHVYNPLNMSYVQKNTSDWYRHLISIIALSNQRVGPISISLIPDNLRPREHRIDHRFLERKMLLLLLGVSTVMFIFVCISTTRLTQQ